MANSTVIPCLRYRDAPAAIEWLVEVFGFEKRLVVPGPDETIRHAQLTLGDGMIMLGSVRDDEFGGAETMAPYVVIDSVETHYQRAKAAGAEIVVDIADAEDRGPFYSCRDIEGRLWSFGAYDPWAAR